MKLNKKELNPKEIKNIQLEILRSIHTFCIEHNLRYSLAFGTLLGAIRHKGYIPWDDDVDIMMPRPDYDIFMSEYMNQRFVVQNYKNDESYFLSLAKVYDKRTEQIIFPTKTGVFVDIFPIEGLPDKEDDAKSYIDKYTHLIFHDILFTCKNNAYRPGNKWLNAFKYVMKRLLYPSRQKGIDKLDALINSCPYGSTNHAGFVLIETGMKGYLNKQLFENYVLVPFEGEEYCVIADYDSFLKSRYGDYMQLPPEDQRVPGHSAPVYWKEDNR